MVDSKDKAEARDVKHKACDACKRRKVRCSGKQPCQHCLRAREECLYSSPHGRLANAERRAHRSEARVRLLEAAWTKFMPHMSVEAALADVAGSQDQPLDFNSRPNSLTPVSTSEGYLLVKDRNVVSDSSASEREYEHERADSLEWDESADLLALADGIGSLSVQTAGIGYMGPQSGNTLLRKLQSMSGWALLSEAELTPDHNNEIQVPEQILESSAFFNKCVDAYFRCYHTAYPILHEGYFRAQVMGRSES